MLRGLSNSGLDLIFNLKTNDSDYMKSVRGVAMVEAVIFIPLMLLCIIIAIQFYLLFAEYYSMVQAAREMVIQGSNLVRPIGAGCGQQNCTLGTITESDYMNCVTNPLANPACTYTVMCWTGEQVMNTRRSTFLVSNYSLSAELAWFGTGAGGAPLAPLLVKARVSGTFGGFFSMFGGVPLSYEAQSGYLARFYGCGSDAFTSSAA